MPDPFENIIILSLQKIRSEVYRLPLGLVNFVKRLNYAGSSAGLLFRTSCRFDARITSQMVMLTRKFITVIADAYLPA